jgi:hypothetical protein
MGKERKQTQSKNKPTAVDRIASVRATIEKETVCDCSLFSPTPLSNVHF